MAAGWGDGRAGAPLADWKLHRIGADPPGALVTLRDDAERATLAACGPQPELAYGRVRRPRSGKPAGNSFA